MRIGLGIDTGGTYTDSVLLDLETGQVIRKAKALTTYPNLEVGIADALNGLMFESQEAKDQQSGSLLRFSPQEITLVAVSTTLATNAMVEDKGRSACLLAVGLLPNLLEKKGLDQPPFIELRHLAGGHNADGEERHSLDLAAAERAIEETKDSVEAYAVAALGSSFNPSHEIRLEEDSVDPLWEEEPLLATITAASVQGAGGHRRPCRATRAAPADRSGRGGEQWPVVLFLPWFFPACGHLCGSLGPGPAGKAVPVCHSPAAGGRSLADPGRRAGGVLAEVGLVTW